MRYFTFLFWICISSFAYAASPEQALQSYWYSLKTLQADFIQLDAITGDKTAKGELFLAKPGKLKFEYKSPKHLLLLLKGEKALYYDYELEELSHTNVDNNLILLLSSNNLLNLKISVKNVEDGVFASYSDDKYGKITLHFALNPMRLDEIHSTLPDGNQVIIRLINIRQNQPLSSKIFEFKDPKFFKLRK